MTCKICGAPAALIGSKKGAHRDRVFHFHRCESCGFTFVANPWTDYAQIYNEAYYRGHGPDPWIDYVFELEHPERTVRIYEWTGILQVVQQLTKVSTETKWLDFGCGNGGLVRHVRKAAKCGIVGFEEGWIADQARAFGIPILTPGELAPLDGTFDVVTAIEVIEHVENPVEFLRRIRRLLKPGGLLFLTTGNAKPQRGKILDWGYAVPEIHISFFEPETMALAMQKAGFKPQFRGFLPGFDAIIRYKILKNLKKREIGGWESALPWRLLSRLANRSHQVTAHPVAWAAPE
ncbi:MAG: class I SAM-dependent methyltransferase [Bryobacteraceae bacterium]